MEKMPNETEKKYNELRKRHRLPEFREMDTEFEISDIEETNFLLRAIIRKMAEKLDFYTAMLEEALQPDTHLYSMHEARFFEDDEKKRMYDAYKKLMFLNRRSIEVLLSSAESAESAFITEEMESWKGIKNELAGFVSKMKDTWNTETDIKESVGYLG